MIFTVYIDSHPVPGGVDEDVLLAAAEVAEKIKRVSDAVVAGGGDPPIISMQFCVEAGEDHVAAAKQGLKVFKDVVKTAGLSGVKIATVQVGPDPCPEEPAPDNQLATASG